MKRSRQRTHNPSQQAPSSAQTGSAPPTLSDLGPRPPMHQVLAWQKAYGNRATMRHIQRTLLRPRPRRRAKRGLIQRGEAGVHHGIEMEGLGVESGHEPLEGVTGDQQHNAMEVYAGNWMRDFSQAFGPTFFNAVAQIPSRPGDLGSAPIGPGGAEPLMVGLLRAVATLEFDPDIVDELITGENIGVYRPEEHMDNPAGGSLSGDALARNPAGQLEPASMGTADQLEGSAVPGPQFENPALYEISESGLANHIYNTIEWAKNNLSEAFSFGATPTGRMKMGTALHGVEDYFAHSNFIEAGMNLLIGENPSLLPPEIAGLPPSDQPGGYPVDTMYDAVVPGEGLGRQAITTGTFTGIDTKISLSHVLLPRLPSLFSRIDHAIDLALNQLEQPGTDWNAIRQMLMETAEGQTGLYVLEGMNESGLQLPTLSVDKWQIPDMPGWFPDSLEGLEGRWLVTGLTEGWATPSEAVPTYKQFYDDVKAIWEFKDELKAALNPLAILLSTVGLQEWAAKISQAVEMLKKSIPEMINQLRETIKKKIRDHLYALFEMMTGVNIPEEQRKLIEMAAQGKQEALEQVLGFIHHTVEEMVHTTSLEVQTAEGGALANLPEEERNRRIPEGALPPSHSEISKDHPSLEEHGGGDHSVQGPSTESAFYQVHRLLAVEAVKHIAALMEQAWQSQDHTSEIIEGRAQEFDPAEMEARNREAELVSGRSGALAAREGRRFAQAEGVSPDLEPVLNAVDLYISHPEDSTWWRGYMLDYLNATPPEVLLEQIRHRNEMRGERHTEMPGVGDLIEGYVHGHP